MPKVTVRARSLKDASTNFISIVDKGANRLPIRMLKSEKNDMFDITKVFNRKKAEPMAEAVALIVASTQAESYATALKAEHNAEVFILDCPNNEDTKCVSLKSELDLTPESITAINLGDRAVVIENGQKMLKDWGIDQDTSFAENVAANGFYSGVRIASDTLASGIWDAMEGSDANVRPTEAVRALLQAHMDYVLGLVEAVPLTAFKMEAIQPVTEEAENTNVTSEDNTDGTTDTNGEPEQGGTVDTDTTETVTEDQTNPEQVADVDAEAETTEATEAGEPTPEAETAEKSEAPTGDVLAAISNLTELVSGLKNEVATLQDSVNSTGDTLNTVTQQVRKAETNATKALEAAHGTVVDTDDGVETVQKSEESHTRTFKHSNIESA